MKKIRNFLIVLLSTILFLNIPLSLADQEDVHKQKSLTQFNKIEETGFVTETESETGAMFVKDEVVVSYADGSFGVKKIASNKKVKEVVRNFDQRKFNVSDLAPSEASASLKEVVAVEPNYLARAFFVPNDPLYSHQWHLDNSTGSGINMEKAWDISRGEGVLVAVVDTGVAYENRGPYYKAEDLSDTCIVAGYDFVNKDPYANDDHSHGTHVAGTIAQSTNNGVGVAGIAFNACIMPVKVLGRYGFGTYEDVAAGIKFATDHGAQIINMSLGGDVPAKVLENAVAYAYNKGVVIVAASGNSASSQKFYPAAYDKYVISVAATDFNKNPTWYTNFGSSIDVAAPGGDTSVDLSGDGEPDGVLQNTFNLFTVPNSGFGYHYFNGTSMASPHVAGIAALLLAHGNTSSPQTVRKAIESTARDLGAKGRDDRYGWGLVDAFAALNWPGVKIPTLTTAITSPRKNSLVSGVITITTAVSSTAKIINTSLFVDNTLVSLNSQAPYSFDWNSKNVSEGFHGIKVVSKDEIGQSVSYNSSVYVDNLNDQPDAFIFSNNVLYNGKETVVIMAFDGDKDGKQMVTIDGSSSSDSDGRIVSYSWKEGDKILGTDPILKYEFSVGTHSVKLFVTDDRGAVSEPALATVIVKQSLKVEVGWWPEKSTITRNNEIKTGFYFSKFKITNHEQATLGFDYVFTIKNSADKEIFKLNGNDSKKYEGNGYTCICPTVLLGRLPLNDVVIGQKYIFKVNIYLGGSNSLIGSLQKTVQATKD